MPVRPFTKGCVVSQSYISPSPPASPSISKKNAYRRQQLYQNMGAQCPLAGEKPVWNMGHKGKRRRYLGMHS